MPFVHQALSGAVRQISKNAYLERSAIQNGSDLKVGYVINGMIYSETLYLHRHKFNQFNMDTFNKLRLYIERLERIINLNVT